MDQVTQTLIAMSGQENMVVIRKPFVDFAGSLEAGLLLGQLLYWTPKATRPDGLIAKTDADFGDELCLTRHRLRRARQELEERGILETELHRFNGAPTTHYRLNLQELRSQWIVWIRTIDCVDLDNPLCESIQSLTETTPESEQTEICPADAGGEQVPVDNSAVKASKSKNGTPAAVKVFRENAYRYPAKAWYSKVNETVGEDAMDLDFWAQVVHAYVGLGWNPTNVKNMLAYYENREIPSIKRGQGVFPRGRPNRAPTGKDFISGEFGESIRR